MQTYFDGLYEADAEKLGSVFHQTSELTFVQEGKIVVGHATSGSTTCESARRQVKGSARDDAILSFDQSGPDTAFVKVKCQLPPAYFTDYLVFAKPTARWKLRRRSSRRS